MIIVWAMRTIVFCMIIMRVTVIFIFIFTPHIRLIPGRLDKDLEGWVQVNDHEEKSETDDPENGEKKEFHTEECEKCDNTWCDEGENEKKECYEYSPQIEEDHRIVELECYTDMRDCHPSRGG